MIIHGTDRTLWLMGVLLHADAAAIGLPDLLLVFLPKKQIKKIAPIKKRELLGVLLAEVDLMATVV